MISKHFLKSLIIFAGMIALGLVGVFLVSHFDNRENTAASTIAK